MDKGRQFYQDFLALRKEPIWEEFDKDEQEYLIGEAKKLLSHLNSRGHFPEHNEARASAETEKQYQNLNQKQNESQGILDKIINPIGRGVINIGFNTGKLGGFLLDAVGADETAGDLMENIRGKEEFLEAAIPRMNKNINEMSLSDAPEFVWQTAAENLPTMLLTGAAGKALTGATLPAALGGGTISPTVAQGAATMASMSIPEIYDSVQEAGGSALPALIGAVPHAIIENVAGFTPAKLANLFTKEAVKGAGKEGLKSVIYSSLKDAGWEGLEEVGQGVVERLTKHFASKPYEQAVSSISEEFADPRTRWSMLTEFAGGASFGLVGGAGNVAKKAAHLAIERGEERRAFKLIENAINSGKIKDVKEIKRLITVRKAIEEHIKLSKPVFTEDQLMLEYDPRIPSGPVITDATAETFQEERERVSTPQELLRDSSTDGTMEDYQAYQQEKDQSRLLEEELPKTPISIAKKYLEIRKLPEGHPAKAKFMAYLEKKGLAPITPMTYPDGKIGDQLQALDLAESENSSESFEYDPSQEQPLQIGFEGRAVMPDGSVVRDSSNDDFISLKSGNPFKSEKAAKVYRSKNKLKESHDVIPVRGGFVLVEKSTGATPQRYDVEAPRADGQGISIIDKSGQIPTHGKMKLSGNSDASLLEQKIIKAEETQKTAEVEESQTPYTLKQSLGAYEILSPEGKQVFWGTNETAAKTKLDEFNNGKVAPAEPNINFPSKSETSNKKPSLKISFENANSLASAAKLRKSANSMLEKAEEDLNRDRQTNTARRARMAAGSTADAQNREAFARTMLNLADALEAGEIKYLTNVSSRPDIQVFEDVSKETARRAHAWNSFNPERAGAYERMSYSEHLQSVKKELFDLAKTEEQKNIAEHEFERYRQGYKKRFLERLSATGKTLSSAVTGPAKFPTRRNQKALNSEHSKMEAVQKYSEKALRAAKKAIAPNRFAVSSDQENALELLQEKLDQAIESQETMKAANKIVKSKKLSKEEKLKKLVEIKGISEKSAKELFEPDYGGRIGFPSYSLTNNNANIRRLKARIEELSIKKSQETKEFKFDGGEIVDNVEDNRLQIFFDEKPDKELRSKLKKRGFKWAPSKKAWQRMRSIDANYAVQDITGIDVSKSEKTGKGIKLYSIEYLAAKYAAKGIKQASKVIRKAYSLFKTNMAKFSNWAKAMSKEFGKTIHKHLRQLWKDIQTHHKYVLSSRRGAIGARFSEIEKNFPVDNAEPKVINPKDKDMIQQVAAEFKSWPNSIKAADGNEILLHNPEGGSLGKRVHHLIRNAKSKKIDQKKVEWVANIPETLKNAAIRMIDKETGNKLYVRGYSNGDKHIVVVKPDGSIGTHGLFQGKLITQFKYESDSRQSYMVIDWENSDKIKTAGTAKSDNSNSAREAVTSKSDNDSESLNKEAIREPAVNENIKKNQSSVKPFKNSRRGGTDLLAVSPEKKLKEAQKKERFVKPSDFSWKKDNFKKARLEYTDALTGKTSTIATINKNAKNQWEWAGTNEAFLTLPTARKIVKSSIYERIKEQQKETAKGKRIDARSAALKEARKQRQELKEHKKKQKVERYLSEAEKRVKEHKSKLDKRELPETATAKMERFAEKFTKAFFDRRAPLKKIQEIVEKMRGKSLQDSHNAYERFDVVHGRIESQKADFEEKHWKPLMDFLDDNGITYDDFNTFAYAMHAPERNDHVWNINPEFKKRGIAGSGWSDKKAAKKLEEVSKKYGLDVLMEAGEMFWGMHSNLLEKQVEYGLLDAEVKDIIDKKYKYYTPLKRIPDGANKLDKRALGRTSEAEHHLTYSKAAIDTTFGRGEYNRVYQAFARMALMNPAKEIYELDIGKMQPYFDEKTGEVQYRLDKFSDRESVVHAKFAGNDIGILVKDQDLLEAFKTNDGGKIEKLFRFTRPVNALLSATNTAFNIDFILTNIARDVQTAFAHAGVSNSKSIAKDIISNIPKATKTAYEYHKGKSSKETKLFKEFLLEGGKTGYNDIYQIEELATKLEKEMNERLKKGWAFKSKQFGKALLDIVGTANDIAESSTRFSGYMAARKAGMTKQKAAAFAKNLTINFNKRGEWGTLINSLYVFGNASLQGTALTGKVIKSLIKTNKGRAVLAGAIGFGFAMDVLNRMLSGYDEEEEKSYYDKLGSEFKDNNIVIMLGSDRYIAIPMAYGLNLLPALGRNTSAYLFGDQGLKQTAGNIMGVGFSAFSPVGSDNRGVLANITPSVTKALYDFDTNTKWTGRRIKPGQPAFGGKMPDSERYFEHTNKHLVQFCKWLNEFSGGDKYKASEWPLTDWSPADVQHIIETYSGGVGKTITRTLDTASRVANNEDTQPENIPIIRRFYGRVRDYNVYDEFRANLETKKLVERVRRDKNHAWLRENKKAVKTYNLVKQAQKIINKIQERRISDEEKKKKVMSVQKRLNAAVRRLK